MNSDCCNKPTLTFPNGTYNATQVRLYGIVQRSFVTPVNRPDTLRSTDNRVETQISLFDDSDEAERASEEVAKLREKNTSEEDILLKVSTIYERDSTSSLPVIYSSYIAIDLKTSGGNAYILAQSSNIGVPISCGIIVGYAYEGHCYDLPKPKIMLIRSIPRQIPKDDCTYQEKADYGYRLWIVDKLDDCIEFDMNQGFIEQIVLEANLPGKRSPSMYASKMMMGHRGGKLGEP